MNDVVREVGLAVGNEYFLAFDPVMIALAIRLGAQPRQIRSRLRLGQVHGAVPLATDQFRQVGRFLVVGAVGAQELDRPLGEQGTEAEGHVGGIPDFGNRRRDQPRQALASVLRIEGDAVPSALDETGIGLTKAVRRPHNTIFEAAARGIADAVERGQDLAAEPGGLFEHRVNQIGAGVFVSRQGGYGVQAGDLVDDKTNVVEGGGICGHRLKDLSRVHDVVRVECPFHGTHEIDFFSRLIA